MAKGFSSKRAGTNTPKKPSSKSRKSDYRKMLTRRLTSVFKNFQAASELIKASVEPVLEQYRSMILSSLKFSKLTLGTVAPQFTGGFTALTLGLVFAASL